MSQTARITRISFRGVPAYLGEHRGNPLFSGNPQRVAEWLCDGYRTRFNQYRSHRCKSVYENGQKVLDDTGKPVLVPIGSSVVTLRHTQARQQFPHLAAIPSNILQAPERQESTEWFSATKRRKTLISQGKYGGAMPGFRSRKRGDRRFSCWFNGGRNAVFHRTGKRSGMVVIRGQNPASVSRKGRWEVRFHVTVSQDIRPYTSVQVDLSANRVTFVSPALAVDRSRATGTVGIDRGVVHAAATSDGELFDLPDTTPLDNRIVYVQKRMAKSRRVAETEGRNWRIASRYRKLRSLHAELQRHRAAIKNDAMHKFTTEVSRRSEEVVTEALPVKSMTKSAKGTVEKPGRNVRQKAGLNRGILDSRWSLMIDQLRYKTGSTEEHPKVFLVNPAYTSQRCFACGHIAPENRESQAEFRCEACGYVDNADVNAARNILAKHLQGWTSPPRSKGQTLTVSVVSAPAMKRKPPALARS
jgi:transposase